MCRPKMSRTVRRKVVATSELWKSPSRIPPAADATQTRRRPRQVDPLRQGTAIETEATAWKWIADEQSSPPSWGPEKSGTAMSEALPEGLPPRPCPEPLPPQLPEPPRERTGTGTGTQASTGRPAPPAAAGTQARLPAGPPPGDCPTTAHPLSLRGPGEGTAAGTGRETAGTAEPPVETETLPETLTGTLPETLTGTPETFPESPETFLGTPGTSGTLHGMGETPAGEERGLPQPGQTAGSGVGAAGTPGSGLGWGTPRGGGWRRVRRDGAVGTAPPRPPPTPPGRRPRRPVRGRRPSPGRSPPGPPRPRRDPGHRPASPDPDLPM